MSQYSCSQCITLIMQVIPTWCTPQLLYLITCSLACHLIWHLLCRPITATVAQPATLATRYTTPPAQGSCDPVWLKVSCIHTITCPSPINQSILKVCCTTPLSPTKVCGLLHPSLALLCCFEKIEYDKPPLLIKLSQSRVLYCEVILNVWRCGITQGHWYLVPLHKAHQHQLKPNTNPTNTKIMMMIMELISYPSFLLTLHFNRVILGLTKINCSED